MNKQTLISIGVIVVAVIGGLVILQSASQKNAGVPGQYDALASCIAESGATFYGAFWCPHCNNQKKAFKDSVDLLPYTECSTPDGNGQTQVCIDANIQSYPTWAFADGSRLAGEQDLQTLAAKTGCEAFLPENQSTEEVVVEQEA
ncbi:MAG: hypothetical protein QG580_147 [Patescibacteria group bacterium]|jgi:hypothetical protein|nr:hypothetical protein [Patescibacteria group bacterium]